MSKVSDVCRATGITRATVDRYYYDKGEQFRPRSAVQVATFYKLSLALSARDR